MRRTLVAVVAALVVATTALAGSKPFPERIALPNGWNPEGIAIAPGGTFYVGSIGTGDVYRGSLRTGKGARRVDAPDGRAAIGVEYAGKRLVVAGGPTGHGYLYDAHTGAALADYTLATPPATFVNDVVVARGVAWFTDSSNPVLYKVTLATGAVQSVPLSGEYRHQAGQFNLNGIDATANGKRLVVVQSSTGFLFTVDPATGATKRIAFGGDLARGDGILLDGKRLWVVRNTVNEIVELRLSSDLASAREVRRITSPLFRVPTTIDDFGKRIYAVNARFGTSVTPTTDYDVVRVPASKRP